MKKDVNLPMDLINSGKITNTTQSIKPNNVEASKTITSASMEIDAISSM